MRAFTTDKLKLWVEWLPLAEFWFNTNFHTSAKMTPFEALYGFEPPKLLDYIPGITKAATVDEYLLTRQHVLSLLRSNLIVAQDQMKLQADKHRQERYFEEGDWVFLRLQPFKQKSLQLKQVGKLAPKFFGLFKVVTEDWNSSIQARVTT